MGQNRRTVKLILVILLLCGAGWLANYAYEQGFTKKWRNLIISELAKNGIRATIGRVTIDPFNGLTARDVSFYSMEGKGLHLADISSLSLDVDLAKVVDRENFLRSIDLRNASLSLPVDPNNVDTEVVNLREINARIYFDGERINIARADGNLAGLRVRVRGQLTIPKTAKKTPAEETAEKEETKRRWAEVKARRGALQQLIQTLERLKSKTDSRPELEIQVDGSPRDFRNMKIDVSLRSDRFVCGEFEGKNLRLDGGMQGGVVTLRNFEITDKHGVLKGQASWLPWEGQDVKFWMDSSIDLHSLAKATLEFPRLGEVVFYDPPPKVRADGTYFLNRPWTETDWPMEMVAKIDCDGHIQSRGVIFQGLHADIGLQKGDFYVRNFVLSHHSGDARGKFLRTSTGGVRYHLKWGMELKNVLPFLPAGAPMGWFEDFEFKKDSSVDIELLGAGSSLHPESWSGSIAADLKRFSHRDVFFRQVTASASLVGGKCIVRDAVVERPEGEVTIRQINISPAEHLLEFVGVEGNVFPVPLVRCAGREIERTLADYVFTKPPKATFDGKFYLKDPARSEFKATFTSDEPMVLKVANLNKNVDSAFGTVSQKNEVIIVDVQGRPAAGSSYSVVGCDISPKLKFLGNFGILKQHGKVNNWQLEVDAPTGMHATLAGKKVPLANIKGLVTKDHAMLAIAGTGTVSGGPFEANFSWADVNSRDGFQADLRLSTADYRRLSAIYDPATKSEGQLSGNFVFTGSGTSESIKGKGQILLENNDVFSVPLLGPLSKLVTTVLPLDKIVYSTAREARADFTVQNGIVESKNFSAKTPAFELKVGGIVNLQDDRVGLTARMNVRGIPGILLFPVSKILEYEAQGTLKDPGWQLKHIPLPNLPKIPFLNPRREEPTPRE